MVETGKTPKFLRTYTRKPPGRLKAHSLR